MSREEQLDLAVRLAPFFKVHSMWQHLEALRAFYRRVRDGRTPRRQEWDENFVRRWAGMLRLAPCEEMFELRPWGSACPCTAGAAHHGIRPVVFPDGALMQCLACRREWLEPWVGDENPGLRCQA